MSDTTVDTVVVGAGLAGLVAAHALVGAGQRVRLVEARRRVGGRAHSHAVPEGVVDLGATWFWPDETDVGALARELGVRTHPQHLTGNALLERTAPASARDVQVLAVDENPIDVPAHRFVAGAAQLAERLAGALPAGVLALESAVTAVGGTEQGVVVDVSAHGRGLTLHASHVIVAVPPALAVATIEFTDGLDPELATTAARTTVWMGEVVKAVAVYDRAFWRDRGLAGAAVSHVGPFREFHDHSGVDGTPAAIFGFAPSATLAGLATEQVQHAFVHQLVRIFGSDAAGPTAVHAVDWSQERWTVPPTASRAPSTTALFGHPIFTSANPSARILWGSTETADRHAGHLDGAVRAGALAARTALGAATAGVHAHDAGAPR